MAVIYIGVYQQTAKLTEAVQILSSKGHHVEVFIASEPLVARILEQVPHVLMLPLYFKKSLILFHEVLERIRDPLIAGSCQVGMFAIMKEDGDPTISWGLKEIHYYLLEPFTAMQIVCGIEFLIHRKVEYRDPPS